MDLYAFVLARSGGLTGHQKMALHADGPGVIPGPESMDGDPAWLPGMDAGAAKKAPLLLALARQDLRAWESGRFGVVGLWEERYPALLKEIWDPPLLLWYRGRLPAATARMVSVVGTRRPTGAGRLAARDFAREAAMQGMGVASGLAFGIDAAAHRGALDGGGPTLAVLPAGVDLVVPGGNRILAAQILESGGCILTEHPPGVEPRKYQFPRRNRIISGLSPQLLVVEAPRESGALISARIALEEGRDVFVHGDCIGSSRSQGCRDLRDAGAGVVTKVEDVLWT